MKKILSLVLAIMLAATLFSFTASADGITVSVGNIAAQSGESVVVPVTISGNTGIAGALFSVKYDSALTLTAVNAGEAFNTLTFTKPGKLDANPINLTYDGQDADTTNGVIAYLTFTAPEAAGVYPVEISYNMGDIYDQDFNDLELTLVNGAVAVTQNDPIAFTGAQVRTEGKQGLRFIFDLDAQTHSLLSEEDLPESAEDTGIGFGSVVILGKLLGEETLTKETANAKIVPAVKLFKEPGETFTYTACVVDIPTENYTEEYVAVPYITYMDNGVEKTIYGTQTENVTVFNVAELAYADENTESTEKEYLYENVLRVVDPDYEK